MARERIILDVDTGHDDAIAIALAAGLRDEIEITGLIASYGNTSRDNTLSNTLNVAEAIGITAPVFHGSAAPLIRERVSAEGFHGKNGLEGPVFPPRYIQEDKGNGILWALDTVRNNPGAITFVSVGPFTDLAVCLKADPDFAGRLKRIVVMGGSLGRGNVTSSAEFNIYADPEAAEIVFNCGAEVIMMGLDVTRQVLLTGAQYELILNEPETDYKRLFKAQMSFYIKSNMTHNHTMPVMHDPCTIAYLADPSIFRFEPHEIHVETKGNLTYGRTVADGAASEGKVKVGVRADPEKFWKLFMKAFRTLK